MDVVFKLELQLHSLADGEAVGIVSSLVGAVVVLRQRPLRTGPLPWSIWLSKSPLCVFLSFTPVMTECVRSVEVSSKRSGDCRVSDMNFIV